MEKCPLNKQTLREGQIMKFILFLWSLGVVGFLFLHAPVSAEKVSIEHYGLDRVGKFLAHEVTEEIARSPILQVSEQNEDGWKLVLLTLEADDASIYSVVLVRKNFDTIFDQYVLAFNGVCAIGRLGHCAREIVDKVQEPINQFDSNWREFAEPESTIELENHQPDSGE